MNNLRPLVTITVLGLVAWYLYVKINQGALRPGPEATESAQSLSPVAPPPLTHTAPAKAADKPAEPRLAGNSMAPQWPAATSTPTEHNPQSPKPDMPAIPDLPALPAVPDFPSPPGASSPVLSNAAPPASATPSVSAPPLANPVLPGNDVNPTVIPAALPSIDLAKSSPAAGELDSASQQALAAMGLSPAGSSSQPAAPAAPATGGDGRYGAPQDPATNPYYKSPAAAGPVATTGAPAAASFAAVWPTIQLALQRGELARGHQMLSPWFADPSLTPAEAERVETLLGQLAGTVIYSTEHRLEGPYTVKTGETLETIAKAHDVPWQLLAKINGITSPSQLRPGQQLKVIRGPFAAMVDLRRNQMALMVDGRYAGKFPVSAQAAANIPSGEWVVADKPIAPATSTSVYATPGSLTAPAPSPSRAILLRSAASDPAKQGLAVRIAADADQAAAFPGGQPDAAMKLPVLVKVSPRDAEELSDILSIGSRVIIQR